MILISQTFEVIMPDSADRGEAAEQGFVFEDAAYSFRELVAMITVGGFDQPSCRPASGATHEWLTAYGEAGMRDGEIENFAVHYSRNNNERAAKYWRKAFKVAGVLK